MAERALQRGGADVGAYILIAFLAFWCAVAFSLNEMLLDTAFEVANSLMDRGREPLSMIVTCIGLLMTLPYILAMAILDFIFRR